MPNAVCVFIIECLVREIVHQVAGGGRKQPAVANREKALRERNRDEPVFARHF